MTSARLKELQHYPIHTDAQIDEVCAFVESLALGVAAGLVYPWWVNTLGKRTRYANQFGTPDEWTVQRPAPPPAEPRLFYTPRNLFGNEAMRIEVCRPGDKQAEMTYLYNAPLTHTEGRNQWYYMVTMHWLGITRAETTRFLNKQGNAQVGRSYQKRINKPVLAACSNEHWQLDCIDMAKYVYHQYEFILTCVDIFSGKVWLRRMTRPLNASDKGKGRLHRHHNCGRVFPARVSNGPRQ